MSSRAVRVRWLDGISSRWISKHAIACKLDIKQMLFPVSPGFRNLIFDAFSPACKTLHWFAVSGPNKTFAVAVPMKFETLLPQHSDWHSDVDLEPMS